MNLRKPYLTKTQGTGVYGYRRRVMPKYRALFGGKREIKKSFKTKDLTRAISLLERMDQWFENMISTKGLTAVPSQWTERQKLKLALDHLKQVDILPPQFEAIDPLNLTIENRNFVEWLRLEQEIGDCFKATTQAGRAYHRAKEALLSDVNWSDPPPHPSAAQSDITLATEQEMTELKDLWSRFEGLDKKRKSLEEAQACIPVSASIKQYQNRNSEIERLNDGFPLYMWERQHWTDAERMALAVLQGGNIAITATWKSAVEEYLASQQDEVRNKSQERKWRKSTWSACERLSAFLVHGMDTKLKAIERADVEDAVREIWANPSTRKRGTRIYQAVINSWNIRYPEQAVPNMFLRLVSDTAVKNAKRDRRSFSPEEYGEVWRLVHSEPDAEIRLLATLSLYAGIPSGEVAGLDFYDLRFDRISPHVKIRTNNHRFLGKKRYERSIPLVGFILDEVRSYVKGRDFKDDRRVFPSFFRMDGSINSDKLSKHMNRFVVHKIKSDQRLVSWYSGRHTFKDICDVVGVSDSHSRYLMGHVDPGGGSHKEYGTKPPVKALIADMEKVLNWREYEWGDYDQ